jgi:hypothetical protein
MAGPRREARPSDQETFAAIVADGKIAFEEGTSLMRSSAREIRGRRLRELLEPSNFAFSDWEATVADVAPSRVYGLFKPLKSLVLTLSVNDVALLSNSSMSFGANVPNQAITESSPLWGLASGLQKAQRIRVSGRFLVDGARQPLEASFTEESAMVRPKFLVELTQILK